MRPFLPRRLSRKPVVTASTDRLDFFEPLYANQSVCLESFVFGTGRTSMEVFVKVTGEDLPTGRRFIAATCFMTFVAVAIYRKDTHYHAFNPKQPKKFCRQRLSHSQRKPHARFKITRSICQRDFTRPTLDVKIQEK